MKLTSEQINAIIYFCQEKGDPERYVAWEELLPQVKVEFPELIEAWEARKAASKRFHEIVSRIAEAQP